MALKPSASGLDAGRAELFELFSNEKLWSKMLFSSSDATPREFGKR